MPPTVHDELSAMLRDRDVDDAVFSKLDTWIIRKSPDRYGVTVPADVVHGFVREMSDRVDRGLRVAEDAVREAERLDPDEVDDDDGFVSAGEEVVSDLRANYRDALRRGILDSREDFDLLVPARELDAGVVTEDRGVVAWADDFGLRYVRGGQFPTLLREYASVSGVDVENGGARLGDGAE